MLRFASLVVLLSLTMVNVGCQRPWGSRAGCLGCNPNRYWGDWYEANSRCEHCDCYGNWTGAPAGFAPQRMPRYASYQTAPAAQAATPIVDAAEANVAIPNN